MKNITFFTPNSFTLNGDEYNELFNVITVDEIQDYKIQIFNRSRERTFYSNDIYKIWDGTFEGYIAQQGIYTWKIQYSCKKKLQSSIGVLTLISTF